VVAIGAACGLAAPACLKFSAFACETDDQCDLGGGLPMGTCVQPVGFCAYPDAQCPSGLRFDASAGDGLGEECVNDGTPGTGDATVGDDDDTDASATETEDTTAGMPPTTGDVTGPDPSTGGDTQAVCGGAGAECCAGDACDPGLECMGSGCGCVASVAAGLRHTCAVKIDGTVWCWGAGDLGQLGMDLGPGMTMSTLPLEVPAELGAGMEAELVAAREHTCVSRSDGSAICWGHNTNGKADPLSLENMVPPTVTTWAMSPTTVGVGQNHSCVGRDEGISATCWGDNASGQLGTAAAGPGPFDVTIAGFEPAQIVGGTAHTCASNLMGAVYCWGANGSGQLARDPVTVPSSDAPLVVPVDPVGALSSGDEHVCARVGTTAWCWGANSLGQLGDGTGIASFTPVAVALPPTAGAVTDVVSGPDQSCAIVAGGGLWCWGSNASGQLLLEPDKMGNDMYTLAPQEIEVGATVLQVATGGTQTCALTDEGTVLCWGINDFGQNGNGTTNYGFSPTPVELECP
jgi:alpha-tubulin suppressor-like RCC1 family protein